MPEETQIFDAIRAGDAQRIRDLLTQDPASSRARDEDGISAAITAVYYGQPEIATLLIDAGAEVDVFMAAALGLVDQLDALLVDNPQLVTSYSPDGWTPLALAAFFGQATAVERLLRVGANTEQRSTNATSNMPLHAAIAGKHENIVTLLLDGGADVNAPDGRGWTPLNLASHEGPLSLVRLLLRHGADPSISNNDDDSPLDTAVKQGQTEIAAFLRKHEPVS